MKYAIAFCYFATFCTLLRFFGRFENRSIFYGVAMLCALSMFAVLNDMTGLILEKGASFISYDMFKGDALLTTFYLQYLLAWIPFQLLDYEYTAHGMNIGLQAFTFLLAAQYIFGMKTSWKLLAFSLVPSYFHYSIFGLRDPLINLIVTTIAIAAMRLDAKQFVYLCLVSALMCMAVRPELSLIILGFACLRVYFDATKWQRVTLILLSGFVVYASLIVLPLAFGLSSTGSALNNIDVMVQFNEIRSERHVGTDGSGSHILNGQLFTYPFLVRYPIQIFVSFVSPLPSEIRGMLGAIAFAESILLCFVAYLAASAARTDSTARFLFFCGLIYIFLQALFAFNYGNLLRVRYPSFIFFFGAIACSDLLLGQKGIRGVPIKLKENRLKTYRG